MLIWKECNCIPYAFHDALLGVCSAILKAKSTPRNMQLGNLVCWDGSGCLCLPVKVKFFQHPPPCVSGTCILPVVVAGGVGLSCLSPIQNKLEDKRLFSDL